MQKTPLYKQFQPELQLLASYRAHIDVYECPAENWLMLRGWIAGPPRNSVGLNGPWERALLLFEERPDVCQALAMDSGVAYGFIAHLFGPEEGGEDSVRLELVAEGSAFASVSCDLSQVACERVIRFPSPAARRLTQGLFQDPERGCTVEESPEFYLDRHGVIHQHGFLSCFDNTRIGNYHSDVPQILQDPAKVGLDIGCGIRNQVFDNLVTLDVYPTPTATIITRPEERRLPFRSGVFDLVVLDSVLEHVPNPPALLMEAKRVLKPGGLVVGDVPFLQPLHLEPYHYFNFTAYGVKELARRTGLSLEYVAAQDHQRPEFSLEWLLRRTFESIPPEALSQLKKMTVAELLDNLESNKNLIDYPDNSLQELAAGYHFRLVNE